MTTERATISRKREAWGIVLCLLLYFGLRLWGLPSNSINGLFDEGVYVALMQTESEGKAHLYQDIVFGHPPGVIWAGAKLWEPLGKNLFAIRVVYILFNALALFPLYAIARRLQGAKGALAVLFLQATTPAYANWLGRNVFMEFPQNVFVFAGLWLLLCVPKVWAQVLAGGLVGVSFLCKESSLPVGVLLCFGLLVAGWVPRRYSDPASPYAIKKSAWLWTGIGFAVSTAIVLVLLARIPHYWKYFVGYYTLSKNANDTYQVGQKFYELSNGFYALPLQLTFGVLGAWVMLRRPRHAADVWLSVLALTYGFIIFAVPNRFYWRYWASVSPILCLGVVVWWMRFRSESRPAWRRRLALTFAALFGALHLVVLVVYRTRDTHLPEAYKEALQVLRQSPEPLFTFDPIWNAASGRSQTLWAHIGGDVHGRQLAMKANPKEALEAIGRSPIVLLNHEAMYWIREIPEVERTLRANYMTVFLNENPQERHYIEIFRRKVDTTP